MARGKTIFDLDLVRLARWHRRAILLVAFVILSWLSIVVVSMNAFALPELVAFAVMVLYLVLILGSIVCAIMLLIAMRSSVLSIILHGILAFVIAPLVLLSVISGAGRVLRLAGAEMGFVGVSRAEMDKLRPGHCRGCGYSREGLELLAPCPECRRVPMVI